MFLIQFSVRILINKKEKEKGNYNKHYNKVTLSIT